MAPSGAMLSATGCVRDSGGAPALSAWHTGNMSTRSDGAVTPNLRAGSRPRGGGDRLDRQAPARSSWRYAVARSFAWLFTRGYSSCRVEGVENLPIGPSILCFSHQNWIDPLYLLAGLPERPRAYFFGPRQDDMTRGLRNRLMRWAGVAIPFAPDRRGLVAATRRVEELLAGGQRLVIAGEGRIHAGEAVVMPLLDGPAFMALRFGVPLVPVAINGTSWLAFRRRVRVRMGRPIRATPPVVAGLPTSPAHPMAEAIAAMTSQVRQALVDLVADFPDPAPSRWTGGRLTELFNDWPEGSRPPTPPRGGCAENLPSRE